MQQCKDWSTKKRLNGFNRKSKATEDWYDLREDWALIEASIAKQYGIRMRQNTDMPWTEFCTLISGLMPDTPLGQVVSIRSEKDKNTLKNFTKDQHRIRNEWKNRQAKELLSDEAEAAKQIQIFQELCKNAFGGDVNV